MQLQYGNLVQRLKIGSQDKTNTNSQVISLKLMIICWFYYKLLQFRLNNNQ